MRVLALELELALVLVWEPVVTAPSACNSSEREAKGWIFVLAVAAAVAVVAGLSASRSDKGTMLLFDSGCPDAVDTFVAVGDDGSLVTDMLVRR